ncbi:hypothetical protein ATL42_2549 [Sanguibacter antarcticus]|uniref:Uncharacterized protein n=1 Tax=Sanguibacter antarcticus TaxID=372484 RepID=A0A2A9E8S9_9MICO|nr:hypothetical protein ATL42_2549 [Sanguibacter antarcticus]
MLVAALTAAGLSLTGCSSTDDATPTDAASDAALRPTTDPASETSAGAGAGAGCTATEVGTPAGAATTEIVDVDGDGAPDTAWMTGGSGRSFGVTTASGATFSTPIVSASPVPASAVVNVVGDDATPIALVDLGREAQLFSLINCAVTQTVDASDTAYVFDRGFADQGTGVGCTEVVGVLQLAGLRAVQEGGTWTVTRTLVDLSDGGRVAADGTVDVVAEGAAAADPVVTTAQEVSCGDIVAGDGGLAEPEA